MSSSKTERHTHTSRKMGTLCIALFFFSLLLLGVHVGGISRQARGSECCEENDISHNFAQSGGQGKPAALYFPICLLPAQTDSCQRAVMEPSRERLKIM